MELTFLGAAGTVTGSRTLLRSGGTSVLVDCGLFQGYKELRLRNWTAPPFDVRTLDAVVLTHAHLDHSGYLPVLARLGFSGPIYATPATRDLCAILLADSGHLQEEDARFANRHKTSRHTPALPLYTRAEAEATMKLFRTVWYGEPFAVGGVALRFTPVGHLLGAATVRAEAEGRSILFSGDVGRPADPLLRPPAAPAPADYLVLESTYGERAHPVADARAAVLDAASRVLGRGGVLMVPAFAVGRTQVVLHLLAGLIAERAIPSVPIWLDSPLAIEATSLFSRYQDELRLTSAEIAAMSGIARYVRDVDGSKAIDQHKGPMIIVAGSGMLTGGRMLHHLEVFGKDPANGLLFTGYQAAGTRGWSLLHGAESLKMHGTYVPVNAERIVLDSLSGHADAPELVAWLKDVPAPRRVFLNHGEPAAADALRVRLRDALGWTAEIARHADTHTL